MTFPLTCKASQTPYLALGTPYLSLAILSDTILSPLPPTHCAKASLACSYFVEHLKCIFSPLGLLALFSPGTLAPETFGGCLCLIFQVLLKYYFLKVTHLRPAQLKALYPTTPSLLFSLSPYFTSFPTQFTVHNYFYGYKNFVHPAIKM